MSDYTAEDKRKLNWLDRKPPMPEQVAQMAKLEREVTAEGERRGRPFILCADDLNWCLSKLKEIDARNPISLTRLKEHHAWWMDQYDEPPPGVEPGLTALQAVT